VYFNAGNAGHGTFYNGGATVFPGNGGGGQVYFAGGTAANSTIYNYGSPFAGGGGRTSFNTATAGNATLIADGGFGDGGGIVFNGSSAGGASAVAVSGNGFLDISNNGSGVAIWVLEGSGNVFLGAYNLTVTSGSFSGSITSPPAYKIATLTKINGGGQLTLQGRATNDYIASNVGLIINVTPLTGQEINLNFTGSPDVIASLVVNGVAQPPGLYGSAASGAPNQLSELAGPGMLQVGEGSSGSSVATPVISPSTGTYLKSVTVTMSDATSGATIHYTMDGSTPTASSPVYSFGSGKKPKPTKIKLTSSTTVRAIATALNLTNSGIAEADYTIMKKKK
jgi:hypothetical protein